MKQLYPRAKAAGQPAKKTTFKFRITLYVTLGVSAFSYDPYAYLKDEKYNLGQLRSVA
ncbi:hypothetical protein HRG84_15930 [Flavisolibacter sp. BT320]|nr:hypothetical protein [Flavisolibacter longurius]